jgi:nitroreductase
MELTDAVQARYSCRRYADREVPEEVLVRILDAARMAPSAKNLQRTRVVAVRDSEKRKRLAEAARGQTFVGEAPVVLVFCSEGNNEHVMTCGHPSFLLDTAIFQDHVSLLCTDEGLATCWIGAFFAAQVREVLGIPDRVEVVELMPVGYPADDPPQSRSRLPLEEILHREAW